MAFFEFTHTGTKMPKTGCPAGHFFDSGAFTLWSRAAVYAKENGGGQWDFYHTDEFWAYMDSYAEFVKKNSLAIDLYANVDVIPNPYLTWRNQRYLEDRHGLNPVPVVHYQTDLRWLQHYIDEEYDIIGLGGLVGSTSQDDCKKWVDRCFDLVCDTPTRLPRVKMHGFGVTTFFLMTRYPWYSVDSTSWTKIGAYGGIIVPHRRGKKFVYDEIPYLMKVSMESPDRRRKDRHFLSLRPGGAEQEIIQFWLDEIDIPLGEMSPEGKVIEEGVVTHHTYRRAANLFFFEKMRKSLPEYPWPFTSNHRKGLLF